MDPTTWAQLIELVKAVGVGPTAAILFVFWRMRPTLVRQLQLSEAIAARVGVTSEDLKASGTVAEREVPNVAGAVTELLNPPR